MNTAIINLADEGMIYEKYISTLWNITFDLSKMFKTINIYFKASIKDLNHQKFHVYGTHAR